MGYTEENKTVKPRTAGIQTYAGMTVTDDGNRYRFRCNRCGKVGKWYIDPNMMDVMWDRHNDREHN